jgi:hypothetical protein
MKIVAAGLALVMLSCTSQQTTPAASPASAPAVVANPEFKNLQVLPKDITHDQLIATMRGFTQSLGVRCNECHVVTATEPRMQFDYASDAKRDKLAARVMIQTAMDLNKRWIPKVKAALSETPTASPAPASDMEVSCWTCHRGKKQPEAPAPRS